ncbi:MAG: TIGR00366 family protein, partial [Byssovorax sp.]
MPSSLLPRLADGLARVTTRYVPDSFSIACLLTLATFAMGMTLGHAGPIQVLDAWGGGFWELLPFSMQIAVVIFAGYLVSVSPVMTRLLDGLARIPRSPRQAVAATALLSMLICWLNWGMGLIASAVLVRFMARRHPDADYRLLATCTHAKLVNVGKGLSDAGLAIIAQMPEVEAIQMNAADVTDAGVQALASLKTLKTLSIFHPGKAFTGTGLAALAELPSF